MVRVDNPYVAVRIKLLLFVMLWMSTKTGFFTSHQNLHYIKFTLINRAGILSDTNRVRLKEIEHDGLALFILRLITLSGLQIEHFDMFTPSSMISHHWIDVTSSLH